MVGRGTYRDEQDMGTLNLWVLNKTKSFAYMLSFYKAPKPACPKFSEAQGAALCPRIVRIPSVRAVLHG